MRKHRQTISGGRENGTAPPTPTDNGAQLTFRNAPITFRLPPPGQVDPFWQRNRSGWNEIILPTPANGFRPPVKSIVERKPGNAKGRRFIVFESARRYFEHLLVETERETEELARQHSSEATTTASAKV